MGSWAMSSDNSYKGPLQLVEEFEVDEDASSTKSDEEEVDPSEVLEYSPRDDSEVVVTSPSSSSMFIH